jgi:tetratricopeptide (TPR) repeat protein
VGAAADRDRVVRRRIAVCSLGVAAGLTLAIAAIASRADDTSPPLPPESQESGRNDDASAARSPAPVVKAAPLRDLKSGSTEPPKGTAAAIASDTDAPSNNVPADPARPRPMPVVKQFDAGPQALPPELAPTAPPLVERPLTTPGQHLPPVADAPGSSDKSMSPSAPAELKSVLNGVAPSQPLSLQKFSDLPPLAPLTVAPVVFKGVTPGVSSAAELQRLWGEPVAMKESPPRRIFKLAPYKQVQVTVANQKVSAISIELEKPFEPEPLAKQLHLETVIPVTVMDEAGQPIGQSFPERGVLFSFAPQTTLVTQILLEPIDAEPFILRAEVTPDVQIRRALRDLDFALGLEPGSTHARAIAARVLTSVGRLDDALKAINQALEADHNQPAYICSKIEILKLLDRHAEAIELAKELLADENLLPLVKAQTQNELGDLLAEGPDHDYKQAVDLHLAAARTAGALVGDHHTSIRHAAKQAMIEAHLGAACDVAYGTWQQKELVAARWITRADELAKDFVQSGEGDPFVRLHVARRALDARVGIQGRWDSSDWTVRAIKEGQKLVEAADDPLRRERLEWELSLAMLDIGELDQLHGFSDHSLADCQLALKLMVDGTRHRQPTPDDACRLGQLYAQLGMVYAIPQRNHAAAVTWFARALPLLDRPLPPSAASSLGLIGESFVSMGISYWETGHRDDALRLTLKGIDLMTKAVAAKQLDERALAIPYNNLASMHRELGHVDEARGFTETAARYDGPQRR